jgi:hypothetical protein
MNSSVSAALASLSTLSGQAACKLRARQMRRG